MRSLLAAPWLCLALVMPACVTERPLMTWDEAIPAPPPSRPQRARRAPPPAAQPESPAVASTARGDVARRSAAPPDEQFGGGEARKSAISTPAGILIDRALTRFHAERNGDLHLRRRSHVHASRWLRLLTEIDDATTLQPAADDLGAFVRARVTLEVEHERDRERKRALPPDLGTRIDRTLGEVDARVAELRLVAPPGSLGPSRGIASGDEVIVLRAPVSPILVTSPFGVREDPIHGSPRFHAGIDFGAPKGTMVYASAKGVIIYASWQGGYGRHVVIDHGGGIRTHYSHLDQIFVEAGDMVEAGDTLGAVGDTGRATGPHLHFAVTNGDGNFLDPSELFDRQVVRNRISKLVKSKARPRRLAKRR